MNIQSKILATLLPLVALSAGLAGYLALREADRVSRRLTEVSDSLSTLHRAAMQSSRTLAAVLEDRQREVYDFLAWQTREALETKRRYIEKEATALAASPLMPECLSGKPDARDYAQPRLETLFASSIRQYQLSEIRLMDAAGRVLVRQARLRRNLPAEEQLAIEPSSLDAGQTAWFQSALQQTGRTTRIHLVDGIAIGTNAPLPTLLFLTPLAYRGNRFTPTLGPIQGWLALLVAVGDYCTPALGRQDFAPARITVADSRGRVLLRSVPKPAANGKPAPPAFSLEHPALDGILRIRIEAPPEERIAVQSLAGDLTESLRVQSEIGRETAAAAERSVLSFRVRFIGGLSAIVVAALGIGVGLAWRLTSRLKTLSHCAGRIAGGDLDAVPGTGANDEIGHLGQSLDRMRLSLKDQIQQLDRRVTDQTRALRDSEERFRALFNQTGVGIVISDFQGRVEQINPAFTSMTGWTVSDLKNRSIGDITPPEGWEAEVRQVRDLTSGARSALRLEKQLACKDGRRLWVDVTLTVIRGADGHPLCVVGMIGDISERVKAEEHRLSLELQMQHAQKLESLGVLAGGIAHDFNNLLMTVLGNADLAMSELPVHSPALKNLQDIERASRRAADLCRQLLAYSGKGRFVVSRIDLNELIQDMGKLLAVSISKQVTVSYNLADALPPIEADATQIRQVVMNLITNASEAIGRETGAIAVSSGLETVRGGEEDLGMTGEPIPAGSYVFFEVSDTGCGMDEETRSRIFEPFFTTKLSGRGLGLAAVLGIVRGHRGTVRIRSQPGQGTTFRVLLPAAEEAAAAGGGETPPDAQDWTGRGLVLLADDEEAVRTTAERMLRHIGFDVISAGDGEEALARFRENRDRLRLVVLDLAMPRMDGETCFLEMKALRSDIPIVLSSGYDENETVQKFAGRGAAGFIQKPYRVNNLRDVARNALEGGRDKPSFDTADWTAD